MGFFEEPGKILDYANQLDYSSHELGQYPGTRTAPLHEVAPDLFYYVGNKLLTLMYGRDIEDIEWAAKAFFQKITYEDMGSIPENTGWIHKDLNLMTFIVYLTPSNENLGTSIYMPKVEYRTQADQTQKHLQFSNPGRGESSLKYLRALEENQNNFYKVASFSGNYNSISGFSSNLWHGADLSMAQGEERTTLLFLFDSISSDRGFPGIATHTST